MTQIGLSNTFHDYCYSVPTLVQEWIRMASKKSVLALKAVLNKAKGLDFTKG